MPIDLTRAYEGYDESPTKQKILNSAAALFAEKGFTETSIRELASHAGVQGSSIYNHFLSKTAILEFMLEDYVKENSSVYSEADVRETIAQNPTVDGILSCLHTKFADDNAEYYFNVLCTILQEQHRTPVVRNYMQNNMLQIEQHVEFIISLLKKNNVIRHDVNPDFWMKLVSCIFYTFSNRTVLGIGDASPNYAGMDMVGILSELFGILLGTHGVSRDADNYALTAGTP